MRHPIQLSQYLSVTNTPESVNVYEQIIKVRINSILEGSKRQCNRKLDDHLFQDILMKKTVYTQRWTIGINDAPKPFY